MLPSDLHFISWPIKEKLSVFIIALAVAGWIVQIRLALSSFRRKRVAHSLHLYKDSAESRRRGSGWFMFCFYFCIFLGPSNASREPNTSLTSRGDLLASCEYSFTVARSLVSCRSKKPCEQETAGVDYQLPPPYLPCFTPKALEDCSMVRLKANNVPTAHVLILSGNVASPQPLAISRGGKGLSYTRAGRAIVWLWFMWSCMNS